MDGRITIPTFMTGPTNENYFKCAKYPIIHTRLHVDDSQDQVQREGQVKILQEVLWQVYTAAQMKQAIEDAAFHTTTSALAEWGMACVPTMLPNQKPPGHEYPDAAAFVNGEPYDVEITRASPKDASGTNLETYSSLMYEGNIAEPQLSPILYCHHQRHQNSLHQCPRMEYISEDQAAMVPFHDPSHRSFVLLPPRFATELLPDLLGDWTRWYTPVALLPKFEITEREYRNRIETALHSKQKRILERNTGRKTVLIILSQSFSPSDHWVERLNLQSSDGIDGIILADMSGYIGMIHDGRGTKVIKISIIKCDWCQTSQCEHPRVLTVFQEFGGDEETANDLSKYRTMDDAMMAMLQAKVSGG